MLKTETRDVSGLAVTVTQFEALSSIGLLARIGKVVSASLGSLKGLDVSKLSADSDISELAPAIAALFQALPPGDAQALARDVLAGTLVVVDGEAVSLSNPSNINRVFNGRLRDLFTVLAFALSVNYSDFFGAELAGVSMKFPKAGSSSS